MADRITYLEDKIEQLERQRRHVEDEIAKLLEFGDDVYPEDSVLLFRKYYGPRRDRKTGEMLKGPFTYVALKAGDQWWLTGNVGAQRKTWEDLVRFLADGVTELWEASEWQRIS